ncbi:MAG TPA: alpha/beta fold hydrolase [Mycobacteriales bacterium]|nr:alpha/beta fold hydrolase [Mycobacteriales bacterium]
MRVEPYVIEAGSGPAVLLLHAFPLNASMWVAQREALSDGYRVLCPDQRGFGGTQLGHDDPSLDEVADDVAAMLDARKVDTCVLGGLSMGGYVAMAFLRRHPDRVRALVLADTKAGADAEAAVANRLRIAEEVVAAGSSAQLVDELLPTLLGPTTRERRPLVAGRVKALVERAPAYAVAWAQRAMAARPDSYETLRSVAVPALVVVGEEDAMSPRAEADAMVEAIPGATLAVVPEAGHLSAVEHPEAFNAALRGFLDGLA